MLELEYTVHKKRKDEANKMHGMTSLSCRGPQSEAFCKKMSQIDGSICQTCYGTNYEKQYCNLEAMIQENNSIIQSWDNSFESVPYLNLAFLRIDSFGELENKKHFLFLVSLCNKNPHTTVVVWTKRENIVKSVLSKVEKPKNMILIKSSLYVNVQESLPMYFDKVFTVYYLDYARENNIFIQCHGQECRKCMKCYLHNDTVYVNELEKYSTRAIERKEAKNEQR